MRNEYEVTGDVTELYLDTKEGKVTVFIDTSDLDRVKEFPGKWHLHRESKGYKQTYVYGDKKGEQYKGGRLRAKLHRWILQPPSNKEVDHINGVGLDNRRQNLREVTRGKNAQNIRRLHKANRSGYRGVRRNGNNWQAYMHIDGEFYALGNYLTKEEAAAVAAFARKLFMPYSVEAEGGRPQWLDNLI